MTDNSIEIEKLKQELVTARNDANRNRTPQVAKRDLDDLRAEFRNQISDIRREITGAIGINAPQNHASTAKAVRTEDERQTQVIEQGQTCGGYCSGKVECSARAEPTQRSDNLKILKLSERKQLTVLECAGHQVTKELEVETHQSIVSLLVYVAHLRNLGHDVDEKSVASSLRAQRSVLVCLAGKERTVYGPVDVVLKVDFVEIRTVAWVTSDEYLAGQNLLEQERVSAPCCRSG